MFYIFLFKKMPHAYAEVICSCRKSEKYECFSHDNSEFLKDFTCEHFRISVFKKAQLGLLLGFDQLAGLYFDVCCNKCGKHKNISYEAKTFGKNDRKDFILCCGNSINFNFTWAH